LLALPILPLLLLLLLSGCSGKNNTADEAAVTAAPAQTEMPAEADDNAAEESVRHNAARIAGSLDDRQLAAQVIISGIDGKGSLTHDMKLLLTECHAGGIMLFRYNLDTGNDAIKGLIAETVVLADIPPFVAVDHEGGTVNRFRPGVADLPPAISYWETEQEIDKAAALIYADSFNAGKAINSLGVNVNLAPVVEYINENNREFLDDRSYGPDPAFTAAAAAAFITGMEHAGILCAVKHFPGSAGADPHLHPSVLTGDKAALSELVSPFTELILGNYARALMVAHSAVPAWDDENIASLSPAVMGGWLRQELRFNGIIICDDFSMGAAKSTGSLKPETAAVLSLAAGADMILVWPPDLRRTHRAIIAALARGELSRERLEDAARRIIFEKIRMGLMHEEWGMTDGG